MRSLAVTARRPLLVIGLAVAAVVFVAHARNLVGGETFAGRDHLTHTVPAKTYLAESLRDGRIPGWWDGVGMGVPFAANPNHSALYPPAWLVAVTPMPWGADLLLLLHLVLLGVGTAALSRRLGADPLGAVVAAGSLVAGGFVTSTVVHGGPLLTLAWTPWVAWAADRLAASSGRRQRASAAAALAALYGAQILAGDPSFVIITGLVALAVVACRAERRLWSLAWLAAAAAAAGLLAAVVLVPALALGGDTARDLAGVPADVWSMHPVRALEWVWPGMLGDPNLPAHSGARALADASGDTPGLGPSWALGVYIGAPVLLCFAAGLVASARRTRWLLLAAALFVLLALGGYTPIYGWYRTVVLPEQLVRYPEKHLFGALVLVAAVAGVGFSALTSRSLSGRALAGLGAGAALLAGLLGAGLALRSHLGAAIDEVRLRPSIEVEAVLERASGGALSALLVLLLVCGAVAMARRGHGRWAAPLAAAALIGHLIAQGWSLLPTVDRDRVTGTPALLEAVAGEPAAAPLPPRLYRPQALAQQLPEGLADRAARLHDTAVPNVATRYGFGYLVGYDQARSARLRRLWDAASAAGARVLDLYAVDLAVLPASIARPAAMPVLASTPGGDVVLARNPDPRPRAFVAPHWRWYPDDGQVLEALFPRGLEAGAPLRMSTARLTGTGDDRPATDDPQPALPCAIEAPRPEQVTLQCRSERGGYAVLLDAWAPGWSATVDGVDTPIERADVVARAVRVEPGDHRVVFRYRTPGLALGGLISVLAWLDLLVLAVVLRRR